MRPHPDTDGGIGYLLLAAFTFLILVVLFRIIFGA